VVPYFLAPKSTGEPACSLWICAAIATRQWQGHWCQYTSLATTAAPGRDDRGAYFEITP